VIASGIGVAASHYNVDETAARLETGRKDGQTRFAWRGHGNPARINFVAGAVTESGAIFAPPPAAPRAGDGG